MSFQDVVLRCLQAGMGTDLVYHEEVISASRGYRLRAMEKAICQTMQLAARLAGDSDPPEQEMAELANQMATEITAARVRLSNRKRMAAWRKSKASHM